MSKIIELLKEISNALDDVDNLRTVTDLTATENKKYLPEDYEVDGFGKVNVDVKPVLKELTITENGIYTPQEGVDGFSKVVAEFGTSNLPKVKVQSFKVTNECINEDGVWDGESLIDTSEVVSLQDVFLDISNLQKIDMRGWDTCKVVTTKGMFQRCSNIEYVNGEGLDWSGITHNNSLGMQEMFRECSILEEIQGIESWRLQTNTSINLLNMFHSCGKIKSLKFQPVMASSCKGMFYQCYLLADLDVSKIIMENCTDIGYMIGRCSSLTTIDLTTWNVASVTNTLNFSDNSGALRSLIGGRTIDDVLANNISCLRNLKVSINFSTNILDRASLRALINGLADRSETTTQTLTLGATLKAKLTEEDIAIAVGKNWSIA